MSNNNCKLFILTLFLPVYLLPFVFSSPIRDSPFDKFISSLVENKCIMPKELKLPFPESTDPNLSSFSYLSTPLDECRTSDALKDYDEANMLCTEIFDVLKNITCAKYNISLSAVESDHLSDDVCHDFKSLNGSLPQKENYLSTRLTDKILCKVLCSAEKYEQLCKVLFWSYDTLMKIKNTSSSEGQVIQKNGNDFINKVSTDEGSLSVKTNSTNNLKMVPENRETLGKSKDSDSMNPEEESNLNQISQESQNNISNDVDKLISQNISTKKVLPNVQVKTETVNKTINVAKDIATAIQNKSELKNEKLIPDISENSITATQSKSISTLNPQLQSIDDNENKIDADKKPSQQEITNKNSQVNLNGNSSTSFVNGIKDNQNIKNATTGNSLTVENNIDSKEIKTDTKNSSKLNEKPVEPINPDSENDNELKNGNFPNEEDNKSKVKQTNVENQEEKEAEKSKETDYEGADEVLPENDLKVPEPSTQPPALPDEDIEHQDDKDQYNDNENDGDYPKSEYENSLNLPPKNKETEVKSSIAFGSNQMTNGYAGSMDTKDINRISEEIAVIAPFPEQEDSHFFFYFLSIVLIIMAGYLIFHNKQKIIALIVEGRHERRRRSGVGYKKLETK